MRYGPPAAAVLLAVLLQAGAAAATRPAPTISERFATLVAERSTSARCRNLAGRLRNLSILESNARDTAYRDRGARQSRQADLHRKRQMVSQAGCNMPMSPSDPRARRCFELKSQLRQAEQRARTRPVYGATSSAKVARIRRERQEVAAQYRLSGCPGGRVGN